MKLLVRRGRTIGGFQIESPAMRNLLQMMRATDKNDLLIGLSLIRPGPAGSGMKEHYVKRRRGLEKPLYLHESMQQALSETYGVMLYQEDILKVAKAVAGFDLAVGDELRKAISKGRSPEAVAALRGGVRQGRGREGRGRARGARRYGRWCRTSPRTPTARRTRRRTPRSPTRPCGSRRTTRRSFTQRASTIMAGFYHPRVYLEEARRLGVTILALDINDSAARFPDGRKLHPRGLLRR